MGLLHVLLEVAKLEELKPKALSQLFTTYSVFLANALTPDLTRYHLEQHLTASYLGCWTYQVIKTHASTEVHADQVKEN